MGEILVGTAGFDYLDWAESFYPSGLPRESFLEFYSQHFNTVELNSTAYRMPTAAQLQSLAATVPPSFVFSLKAHERLIEISDAATLQKTAKSFLEAVQPLKSAGRLGAVLVQFSSGFVYEVRQRRYLDALLKELQSLPLVLEFRSTDWYNNRVIESCQKRQIALAAQDVPVAQGVTLLDVVTAGHAYLRLRGKNEANQWGSDVSSRYEYDYKVKEMTPLVERLRGLARTAKRIFVYFNNYQNGFAAQNAVLFRKLLTEAGMSA